MHCILHSWSVLKRQESFFGPGQSRTYQRPDKEGGREIVRGQISAQRWLPGRCDIKGLLCHVSCRKCGTPFRRHYSGKSQCIERHVWTSFSLEGENRQEIWPLVE